VRIEKPNRVSRSYVQHLVAIPSRVFELLCPVRETDWVNDWRPKVVFSESGVAEPGCVFLTPSIPDDALWLMTEYDRETCRLQIIKIIPGVVVGTIDIGVEADGDHGSTAHITYAYTSISDHGDRALDEFTEEHFTGFMKTWESELNHYLETGRMLDLEAAEEGG
jgi:hypothetical protein